MLRAIVLMTILDRRHRRGTPTSGLQAAVVYALAFTVEFGAVDDLVLRRGGEDRVRLRQTLLATLGLALLAPAAAAAEDFDPSDEFELKDWVPIHLGPLDMSINKAVVYLLLGAALSMPDRDRHDALAPRAPSPGRGRPSAR